MPLIQSSLSDTTFVVQAQQSGWHRGVITYDTSTNTLTFKPVKPFYAGELVTAVASTKILWDSAGQTVHLKGFAWQFFAKVSAKTYGTFSLKNTIQLPQLLILEAVGDFDNDGFVDFATSANDSDRVFLIRAMDKILTIFHSLVMEHYSRSIILLHNIRIYSLKLYS